VVSDRPLRILVIGGADGLAGQVGSLFRARGAVAEVQPISVVGAGSLGPEALDILIFADDTDAPDRRPEEVSRREMQTAARRLTYEPFRIASLARPLLREAGGKIVLLTRTDACMEHEDRRGRYLERPFRAASHNLWRCFSCEWRAEGIETTVVALAPRQDLSHEFVDLIRAYRTPDSGVELIDPEGRVLGW